MCDHDELKRLAEDASSGPWSVDADDIGRTIVASPVEIVARDTRRNSEFIAAANPATVLSLLSEIAALRGEVERVEADRIRTVDDRMRWTRRTLQAERQRDELRKALERIADEAPYRSGYCQSDVEYGPALSADEMQAVARQTLANQGADQ